MHISGFDFHGFVQSIGKEGDALLLEILRMPKRMVDPGMSDEAFREFKTNCLVHANVTKEQMARRLIKDGEEAHGISDVVGLFSKTGNMDLLSGYISPRQLDMLTAKSLIKGVNRAKGQQAAQGGNAKSDKLQPIRDVCRYLYTQQPEKKPHQTKLKAIRDRVIEYAKDRGHKLSHDQFIKTATGWVSDLRETPLK